MHINDYLKHTRDTVVDIYSMSGDNNEVIHKTITEFGNVLYWESDSGNVIYAEWKIPGQNTMSRLYEEDLKEISGEYYLKSYAENMRRCSE